MIKRLIKISILIIVFILVIIASAVTLLKSEVFNSFIAEKISFYTNKNLNVNMHIGFITGDVLKEFSINEITLALYGDTLISCDQIEIRYDIKQVWKKTVEINKLHISDINVYAQQGTDSSWNFTEIKNFNPDHDTTSTDLKWNISMNDIQIDGITLLIEQFEKNTYMPDYLESSIKLQAYYKDHSLNAIIDTLRLFAQNPEIEILQLQGSFNFTNQTISWDQFFAEINETIIQSQGKANIDSITISPSWIKFEPLNVENLSTFFPEIELYGTPDILIDLTGSEKRYDFNLILKENQQRVQVKALLENLNQNPTYEFSLDVEGLDGQYWTQDEQLKSSVKGNFIAKGQGFDFKKNRFEIRGYFGDIKYGDYSLKDFIIQASKKEDQISGSLSSKTWIGNLNLKFGLQKMFGKPIYELNCDYSNLNLKGLPAIDSIATDLNGNIYLAGQGKTPENLNAKLIVNSYNSKIIDYPINNFKVNAIYNKGDYVFDGLYINTPYIVLSANGNGNIYKSNNIDFEFIPGNIYDLISEFEIPLYSMQGIINGTVTGALDSMKAIVSLDISDLQYDSIQIRELKSDFQLNLIDSIYKGFINVDARNLHYYDFSINSARLSNTFSNNRIKTDIYLIVNDSLSLNFLGRIEGFENPKISVDQLKLNYINTEWTSNHDSIYVLLKPEYAYINRFYMNSGNQNLNIHGYFTFEGDENMDIQIEHFDLAQVPFYMFLDYPVKGFLSSSIKISGTSEEPVIKSNVLINNLEVNQYPIENLIANMIYENDLLRYEGIVNSNLHRNIKSSASIPLHFSISDETYLLMDDSAFRASVRFDSLDIKKLYSFYPIEDISIRGLAFANLTIKNTMNNPNLNGNFDILNGNFENKTFGAYYKNIELNSIIKDNQLSIHKLNLHANKKGKLTLNGFINFKSELALIPSEFQFNIKSTNFQALKSNRAELNFDSDIKAEGTFENPSFNGNITISRSRFNADYYGKYLSQKTDDPNPPLLIMAMQDSILADKDEIYIKPGTKFSGTDFYRNMIGETTLQIPGNTWIRGKDMNFELDGNLRLIKSTENLDLFGNLNVKRGFYKIYGKNFTFNRGTLTFTGGKEINPQLNFAVNYRFRDMEKELRKLNLIITGRLNEPELEFFLDDERIEEKDAIAYVIFGKSINQLSESQLNKLSGNDNFALNLALDQLSDILKETFQLSARLDVIEISGSDNWKNNSVTLGKYITNKLYLSYEQSFSLDKKSKFMDSEKLMLEYQLMRNIILKATNQNTNSGFDLIFKKTWK